MVLLIKGYSFRKSQKTASFYQLAGTKIHLSFAVSDLYLVTNDTGFEFDTSKITQ